MAGKTRHACLILTLLTTGLHAAEKGAWVEPKMSAVKIAASPGPGAWENKPMPVSIPAIYGKVTTLPDGRVTTTIDKPPWTLDLVFTAAAWQYKQERDKSHMPATYQGEVMKNPETGAFRLHLTKGLTYASGKPAR